MTSSNSRERRKRKVTQALIAKEAGVSQTLVSLVLNHASGPESVAEATRKRILETARALGYQVKGGGTRKRTLALILPAVSRAEKLDPAIYDAIEDFYARTQKHVLEAACFEGYSVIVRYYQDSVELTHWLTEWDVDGVLWNAGDEKLLQWISQRFPVAQLHYGNSAGFSPVDAVTADQEQIALLALEYLYERGHRRICFVPGVSKGKTTAVRIRAFRECALAKGVTVYDQFLDEPATVSSWDALSDCLSLAARPETERPTAFILGDPTALMLMRELQNRGFSVPGDFSIIGIDNISAGALYNPPLTSIDVCQKEVSEMAVEMVISRIADPERSCQRIFIAPKIVERKSVGSVGGEGRCRSGASSRGLAKT